MRRRVWVVVGLVLAGWLTGSLSRGAESPEEATVTDAEGKEVKVTALKLGAGTKRLTWLADPNGATEEAKKGPLVFVIRERHSTTLAKGIVSYVPVNAVESIKYDHDKDTATFAVKGVAEPLAGLLQYPNVNVLGLEGTVDGKPATFRGGGVFAKGHIKGVAFAGAAGAGNVRGARP